MIETTSKVGPLLSRTKWFEQRLSLVDSLRLVKYVQAPARRSSPGFVRQAFHTKVIDLSGTEDEIFGQISKNTQYKIRRARRDGVSCHFDGDPTTFRRFYNQAAQDQGRRPIPAGLIETAGVQACLSYAELNGTTLVMHCTLIDSTLNRARLWYSCSWYASEDSSAARNTVGRANRLLHFEDMLHLKNRQVGMYDFGGYSTDETDSKKMAINQFKDGFGGKLLVEANYFSYPLFLAVQSRKFLAQLLRSHDKS